MEHVRAVEDWDGLQFTDLPECVREEFDEHPLRAMEAAGVLLAVYAVRVGAAEIPDEVMQQSVQELGLALGASRFVGLAGQHTNAIGEALLHFRQALESAEPSPRRVREALESMIEHGLQHPDGWRSWRFVESLLLDDEVTRVERAITERDDDAFREAARSALQRLLATVEGI